METAYGLGMANHKLLSALRRTPPSAFFSVVPLRPVSPVHREMGGHQSTEASDAPMSAGKTAPDYPGASAVLVGQAEMEPATSDIDAHVQLSSAHLTVLQSAIRDAQQMLTEYVSKPGLRGRLSEIFSTDLSDEQMARLRMHMTSNLPTIVVEPDNPDRLAAATYYHDTQEMALSQSLVQSGDIPEIIAAILEEFGHRLEHLAVNGGSSQRDAAGDEGKFFADAVIRQIYGLDALKTLRQSGKYDAEDQRTLTREDGTETVVENRRFGGGLIGSIGDIIDDGPSVGDIPVVDDVVDAIPVVGPISVGDIPVVDDVVDVVPVVGPIGVGDIPVVDDVVDVIPVVSPIGVGDIPVVDDVVDATPVVGGPSVTDIISDVSIVAGLVLPVPSPIGLPIGVAFGGTSELLLDLYERLVGRGGDGHGGDVPPEIETVEHLISFAWNKAKEVEEKIVNSEAFKDIVAAGDLALSVAAAVYDPWTLPAVYDHLQKDADVLFGIHLPKNPFWHILHEVEHLSEEGVHAAAKFIDTHVIQPEIGLTAQLVSDLTGRDPAEVKAELEGVEDFVVGFAEGGFSIAEGWAEMVYDPVSAAENGAKLGYLMATDPHGLWDALTAEYKNHSPAEAAGMIAANIADFFLAPEELANETVAAAKARASETLVSLSRGVASSMELHEYELASSAGAILSVEESAAPHEKLLSERSKQSETAHSMIEVLQGQMETFEDAKASASSPTELERLEAAEAALDGELKKWKELEVNNLNQTIRSAAEPQRNLLRILVKDHSATITPYKLGDELHYAIRPKEGSTWNYDSSPNALLADLREKTGDDTLQLGPEGRVHIHGDEFGFEDIDALLEEADHTYETFDRLYERPAGGGRFATFTADLAAVKAADVGITETSDRIIVRADQAFDETAAFDFLKHLQEAQETAQANGKAVTVFSDDLELMTSRVDNEDNNLWNLDNIPVGDYTVMTNHQETVTTVANAGGSNQITKIEGTLTKEGLESRKKFQRKDGKQLAAWRSSNEHTALEIKKTGKLISADDAGHLVSTEVGGGTHVLNLVPQDAWRNEHGDWREYEQNSLKGELEKADVEFVHELEYDDKLSNRPSAINVSSKRTRTADSSVVHDAEGNPAKKRRFDNPVYSEETKTLPRFKHVRHSTQAEVVHAAIEKRPTDMGTGIGTATTFNTTNDELESMLAAFREAFDGPNDGYKIDAANINVRYAKNGNKPPKIIFEVKGERPPWKAAVPDGSAYDATQAREFVENFKRSTGIDTWFTDGKWPPTEPLYSNPALVPGATSIN